MNEKCFNCGRKIRTVTNIIYKCDYCLLSYSLNKRFDRRYMTARNESYHDIVKKLNRKPYSLECKYKEQQAVITLGDQQELMLSEINGEYQYKQIMVEDLPDLYIYDDESQIKKFKERILKSIK